MIPNIVDIPKIISDRKLFEKTVYTPLDDAIKELNNRRNKEISGISDIPEALNEPKAVLFRHLMTPNYEMRRFIHITDALDLPPLFWEYYDDKFTPNNECKHALGKMYFYKGRGKKGGLKINSFKILNFNKSNGKKISSIYTIWGQKLIDFHHEYFDTCFKKFSNYAFDASDWFLKNGGNANGYYKSFLSLFVKNAVLFENFLLDTKEVEFTKDIFLPAFISVFQETGLKPIIVALEPTNIEGDKFWMCYPQTDKEWVENKAKGFLTKIRHRLKYLSHFLFGRFVFSSK